MARRNFPEAVPTPHAVRNPFPYLNQSDVLVGNSETEQDQFRQNRRNSRAGLQELKKDCSQASPRHFCQTPWCRSPPRAGCRTSTFLRCDLDRAPDGRVAGLSLLCTIQYRLSDAKSIQVTAIICRRKATFARQQISGAGQVAAPPNHALRIVRGICVLAPFRHIASMSWKPLAAGSNDPQMPRLVLEKRA